MCPALALRGKHRNRAITSSADILSERTIGTVSTRVLRISRDNKVETNKEDHMVEAEEEEEIGVVLDMAAVVAAVDLEAVDPSRTATT